MKVSHPRTLSGLIVVRLGKADWRISSERDPDELLGYIERQRGGRFEVMWMSDPMRWGYATTFSEALLAFGDSMRFTGEIFDSRVSVVGREYNASVARVHRTTWLKPRGRSSVA